MTENSANSQDQYTGEPALEELIADPIIQAVMRGDGLVEADLRRSVSHARQRLAEDSGS